MRAMILAAGLGLRMRPLTNHIPKPLVSVGGKPLIVYHIENLSKAGIHEIVINISHLGEKIEQLLGSGSQWNVHLHYSREDPVLETGGGIVKALKWLNPDPFLVVSGDIFTHYPFARLPKEPEGLAHLVLTDNPPFNPKGDFALREGKISLNDPPFLNFGGIGVYRPELFKDCEEKPFPLPLLFKNACKNGEITGEYYDGIWYNVGTIEQLKELNQLFPNE